MEHTLYRGILDTSSISIFTKALTGKNYYPILLRKLRLRASTCPSYIVASGKDGLESKSDQT